jgi:hypothetical protein
MFRPPLKTRAEAHDPSALRTAPGDDLRGLLGPGNWNRSFDIYPGTVMCRLTKEIFTPYVGSGNQKPFGLSAFFVAPQLGVDEVTATGTNLYTVWVGGEQAEFEILAPAFDATANWTAANVTDGGFQLLTATNHRLADPHGGKQRQRHCRADQMWSPPTRSWSDEPLQLCHFSVAVGTL